MLGSGSKQENVFCRVENTRLLQSLGTSIGAEHRANPAI
jgi:hypothetical protein